eukprot:CAMPEP_0176164490 /NCGR_PEP_ID=MMETSP0120_2-20121206/84144_1 /TAXON_ID=160619 /ORGANISM="Kryptoperidinium foliaceum, Strain CCMP 1326" /LENGTH=180 /DNA_ID=CAMNT_0017502021 /DNA_START=476 /DNA_END=1015 /DNA_ORIENTATION=-
MAVRRVAIAAVCDQAVELMPLMAAMLPRQKVDHVVGLMIRGRVHRHLAAGACRRHLHVGAQITVPVRAVVRLAPRPVSVEVVLGALRANRGLVPCAADSAIESYAVLAWGRPIHKPAPTHGLDPGSLHARRRFLEQADARPGTGGEERVTRVPNVWARGGTGRAFAGLACDPMLVRARSR